MSNLERDRTEKEIAREGKFGNDEMGVGGKETAKDLDFEKKGKPI